MKAFDSLDQEESVYVHSSRVNEAKDSILSNEFLNWNVESIQFLQVLASTNDQMIWDSKL